MKYGVRVSYDGINWSSWLRFLFAIPSYNKGDNGDINTAFKERECSDLQKVNNSAIYKVEEYK